MSARAALLIPVVLEVLAAGGCGARRTTFARHPEAAAAFDRTASDPKALEIADQVLAAAGGADKWNATRQIRWSVSVTTGQAGMAPIQIEAAWDRWNGRHYQRLRGEGGDVVVMRNLYESGGTGYYQSGPVTRTLLSGDMDHALGNARERWELDTGLMLLPFLLESPGTKLTLAGEAPGEPGQPPLDDLKVTFDPRDPTRTDTYHAIIDRSTHQIARIEIVRHGDPDTKRLGYKVSRWIDIGSGMKLGTVYENLGMVGEVITFTSIAADPEPDETLYVPAVQQ
ncbi:MAG TPA: hypothetical protein VFT22_18995 [Kofleriaceae bacterium]|nr:hypothetical protein [Kofleriaceae bacterium]